MMVAQVWRAPADSDVMVVSATALGTLFTAAEPPCPSCPAESSPQHRAVRSVLSAQVWFAPAVMAVIPITGLAMPSTTTTAAAASLVDPLPSCPWSFLPQHATVPSRLSAQP